MKTHNYIESVGETFVIIISISIAMLLIVTAAMIYFVIRYSRKRNPNPAYIEGNNFLEALWTVIPTALVMVMFYYGWTGFKIMREVPPNAMTIKVTARKWVWFYEYENGRPGYTLKVPVGKPIKLLLKSLDVIHSYYIPAFYIKEDAVPGRENYLWFQADKLGVYDVMCAEYCGLQHSRMLSKIEVVSQEEFDKFYASPIPPELLGEQLVKGKGGCLSCHSIDGSPLVGPSFKGVFGRKSIVVTDGKEREVTVNEDYIKRSMIDPNSDVVMGFPPNVMVSQKGILTDSEIQIIIEYLKGIK